MNILLVEDDIIDAMTVKRTSQELGLPHTIVHVNNGKEALDYLNKGGDFPDVILLDINMPVMDGIEFLENKNKHEEMLMIPTIVLTTSNAETDRISCYKQHAAGYMLKPVEYKEFKDLYQVINNYWSKCERPIYK